MNPNLAMQEGTHYVSGHRRPMLPLWVRGMLEVVAWRHTCPPLTASTSPASPSTKWQIASISPGVIGDNVLLVIRDLICCTFLLLFHGLGDVCFWDTVSLCCSEWPWSPGVSPWGPWVAGMIGPHHHVQHYGKPYTSCVILMESLRPSSQVSAVICLILWLM